MVGCLAASAREPWFGLVAAEKLTLKSMRVLDAGEPDEVLAPHWPDAIPAPLGRRAHLTVYAGGAAEPLEPPFRFVPSASTWIGSFP